MKYHSLTLVFLLCAFSSELQNSVAQTTVPSAAVGQRDLGSYIPVNVSASTPVAVPHGYVMGMNGQLIPVSANPVPVGFMVNGKLVSGSGLLATGVGSSGAGATSATVTTGTQIQKLGDVPNDGTVLPPPGVVRVPLALQADGPDFSPLEEIPANLDRQTHKRLSAGARVRTLLPQIPALKRQDEAEPALPQDLHRWSTGISVVTNGLAARLADDAGLGLRSWGVGLDAGRKVSRKIVGRGKASLSFLKIPDDEAPLGKEVKGVAFDAHGLLDWHPFENGFRTSLGLGFAVTDLSSDLNPTSVRRSHLSPYLGVGYDPSLFRTGADSGKDFAPWIDFGLVGFTNDVRIDNMSTNMAPQLNLGVKRRW